ncbi:hypothetical protein CQ14_06675 [Bradyrhizobium lablabi]|uniref:DUF2786 domain-containing protein n=1 Tax=Bradyrhizobium lablabi TaxID=722472 RepID=A0A0R3MUN3_9BRAD|nr:hypothetical protein [Bradyrhizobium lablabi]KRR21328.1 hypothetical protein CQ14_06675 [Bradyrhizobium lablabi]
MVSDDDIKRRDKLLGMLSSNFDGERATASAMLAKMAASYKMTIPELCQAGAKPASSSGPRPGPGPSPGPKPGPKDPNALDNEMLMMLRKVIDHHLDLVTAWEEEFLENVTDRYYRDADLSPKQTSVAMRILEKVALNAGKPRDGFRPV